MKFSAGRYVANEGTGLTQGYNPIYPYNLIDYRPWTDLNGDGTALNADGTPQVDEIGPSNNPNYGLSTITTEYDPNLPRASNWEYSGGLERQLGNGWALSAMWHRRVYTNFDWLDNLNTSAADWHMAGVWTGPDDPDLPAIARGVQVPIYVTAPDLDIQTGNDFHTAASDDWRTWNGFEVILDGRAAPRRLHDRERHRGHEHRPPLPPGHVRPAEQPPALRDPDAVPADRQAVGSVAAAVRHHDLGAHPGVSGSARPGHLSDQRDVPALVNLGDPDEANPNVEVNLIEPGTVFEDYTTEMQLRFSKVVTINDVRTRFYMDATNITNRARVTSRKPVLRGGGGQERGVPADHRHRAGPTAVVRHADVLLTRLRLRPPGNAGSISRPAFPSL